MIKNRDRLSHPAVLTTPKNVWLAVLLAGLFGPFGLFYATVPGAMIMLVAAIALAMFTFGIGIFLVWPFCVIWAWRATLAYNKRAYLQEHPHRPNSHGPWAHQASGTDLPETPEVGRPRRRAD